jgi:predicted PurR-regulated permease PerM
LGGTIAHGIVGLFIGPIILAVGWQLMMAWIREDQVRDVALPEQSYGRSVKVPQQGEGQMPRM